MRKNHLTVLFAAALLVVAGCKKDNNTDAEKMTFSAGFNNSGAKTEINGYDMSWTAGDVVSINGKEFTADNSGSNSTLSGNKVHEDADGLFKAYYPKNIWNGGNLALPATQTYNGNDLSGVNPMYAQSDNTTLVFSNLCAMVKLQFKGAGKVKQIVASADIALSGDFSIASKEDGSFYAELNSKDEAATVTIDCGNGVELKAEETTVFYIALPQGTYNDLTFTVNFSTNDNKAVKIAGITTLVAGKLYSKEATIFPKGVLSGLFTVGMNGDKPIKVFFSQGNLQYVKNSGTWQFAAKQWETVESNGQNVGADYANQGVVSLFGWGTSGNNPADFGVTDEYYLRYQPYTTTGAQLSPTNNYNLYGYGPSINRMPKSNSNLLVSNGSDWGYNAIRNGGDEKKYGWYSLSTSEFGFLLESRASSKVGETENARWAPLKVNGVIGILLFPDKFAWDDVTMGLAPTVINTPDVNWNTADYTIDQFAAMESAGCVFLPAAGYRNGTTVSRVGAECHYWTSERLNHQFSYYVYVTNH